MKLILLILSILFLFCSKPKEIIMDGIIVKIYQTQNNFDINYHLIIESGKIRFDKSSITYMKYKVGDSVIFNQWEVISLK